MTENQFKKRSTKAWLTSLVGFILMLLLSMNSFAKTEKTSSLKSFLSGATSLENVSEEDLDIDYDEQDRFVRYGEYNEVEINLYGNSYQLDAEFSFAGDTVPAGMQIYKVDNQQALIAGAPLFLDEYCFLVSAKLQDQEGIKEKIERV